MSDYTRWGPYNDGTPAHPGELRRSGSDLGPLGVVALLATLALGGGWLYQALTLSAGLAHWLSICMCVVAGTIVCIIWRWLWTAASLLTAATVIGWAVIMITRAILA